MLDVIIVGGGPAGLSAALVLGRACRQVKVFSHGPTRNAASRASHGFLTRDGISPIEFLRLAREDLRPYETVSVEDVEVLEAHAIDGGFQITDAQGRVFTCRRLLLATGVVDRIPEVPGFKEMFGQSVFHCPYCDGWEFRGQPIAIYGCERRGHGLALELTGWTKDLVLCTDGASGLDASQLDELARNGIAVREERLARLEGPGGRLERIVFDNGSSVAARCLFFTTGQSQASRLAAILGCAINEKGTVRTGPYESTSVAGLYVAGDASRAVQWVIVAAAEGAEAAYDINQWLIRQALKHA